MEKPEVSIVLTTYQRPNELKRALKSIVTQSFSNFELIIVDDASIDETDEVVENFKKKDPRIKYIKLPKNSGSHSLPKNMGTKEAQAPVICYFDDDNVMMRDHVSTLYKAYKRAPHDVVYGSINKVKNL
jgi:glycosyltransferase involved in cell wall biosynthesis